MNHGSLFSGIGGFDLAAEWMGWNNIFHCEWNPFGQQVLKHHFPNSISYHDITKTDFTIHRGNIDILTGGFPCQPYSTAGKRLGKDDERHLFPEMLRCIKEVKPKWIIGENVRGLVSWNGGLVFNEVYDDLEREGYEVQSFLIPAAGVGAPHQRYRIWFVAYNDTNSNSWGLGRSNKKGWNSEYAKWENGTTSQENVANSKSIRQEYALENRELEGRRFRKPNERNFWDSFPSKPPICGGDDGLPRELDNITFSKWRQESIKAYGNAVVPQVVHEIFKAIEKFDELN
jgi:DNA (cytosine-5)-methyltransferase 1